LNVVRLYCEAVLPLIFSFTTTHIFLQDKNAQALELVLSKPVSRAQLLLKRYLLLMVPNIIVMAALILGLGAVYDGLRVPTLIFVSISTLVFMCTLSMSIGMLTNDSRFGAVVTSLWFILWMNADVQNTIGTAKYSALINPFPFGFHPDSFFLPGKMVLLAISSCLIYFCTVSLNRSERLI
jgi:ABC-type transport system involved in multi-copper enzyme maturation permease subunit